MLKLRQLTWILLLMSLVSSLAATSQSASDSGSDETEESFSSGLERDEEHGLCGYRLVDVERTSARQKQSLLSEVQWRLGDG